jgi:hypothetical protein
VIPSFLAGDEVTVYPLTGNHGDGPIYGEARGTWRIPLVRTATASGRSRDRSTVDAVADGEKLTFLISATAGVELGDKVTISGADAFVTELQRFGGALVGHVEVTARWGEP